MVDMTSHYVNVNGIKTHYVEAGEGYPLILVHGGGAGADGYGNWKYSIPLYAKAGFRAIAIDMVGFGKTDKPEDLQYSHDDRINHVVGFIETLGLKDVYLIGNSMGGGCTLGVCMKRPDLVKKNVLMGSAGLKIEFNPSLRVIMDYDFTPEGMRKIVEALTNPNFPIPEDMVQYRYELSLDEGFLQAYKSFMKWAASSPEVAYPEEKIRAVKTPTLVVNGKLDKVVPVTYAYKFLELLENSWGYIMPHTGHWAMIEHPEEFAAVTSNFFLNV